MPSLLFVFSKVVKSMSLRTFLYKFARLLGDISAVQKGPKAIIKRIERRATGRVASKVLRKITK